MRYSITEGLFRSTASTTVIFIYWVEFGAQTSFIPLTLNTPNAEKNLVTPVISVLKIPIVYFSALNDIWEPESVVTTCFSSSINAKYLAGIYPPL